MIPSSFTLTSNMSYTRRTGATGALLDEYQKAIRELQQVLATLPDTLLTEIIDMVTADENCRSLQSILTHVVHAGFGYAVSIHNLKGAAVQRPEKAVRSSFQQYTEDLDKVFTFTELVLSNMQDEELEVFDTARKIHSGWGQVYDPEQMMEHAIVHILRHRRQIVHIKQHNLS